MAGFSVNNYYYCRVISFIYRYMYSTYISWSSLIVLGYFVILDIFTLPGLNQYYKQRIKYLARIQLRASSITI